MKKRLFLILFFAVIAVFANEAFALGSGMGMGPPSPPCGQGGFPPCAVPIDGGIALLAGAGLLFGGKKLFNKSQNPG